MMIKLIGDALAIYFIVVSALWQGMARSGGMQWIIFALAIWWLMGGLAAVVAVATADAGAVVASAGRGRGPTPGQGPKPAGRITTGGRPTLR